MRGVWSEQNPESAPNKRGLVDMRNMRDMRTMSGPNKSRKSIAHLGFEQSFIERARDEAWSEVLVTESTEVNGLLCSRIAIKSIGMDRAFVLCP